MSAILEGGFNFSWKFLGAITQVWIMGLKEEAYIRDIYFLSQIAPTTTRLFSKGKISYCPKWVPTKADLKACFWSHGFLEGGVHPAVLRSYSGSVLRDHL